MSVKDSYSSVRRVQFTAQHSFACKYFPVMYLSNATSHSVLMGYNAIDRVLGEHT